MDNNSSCASPTIEQNMDTVRDADSNDQILVSSSSSYLDDIHPCSPTKPRPIMVAMYDFEAKYEEDLSFKEGDRMQVIDNSEGDWLQVMHLDNKKRGCIPANYVVAELSVKNEGANSVSITRSDDGYPPVPTKPRPIMVGIYNFTAEDEDEISFKKGDRMEVINDFSKGDWLKVMHLYTRERGSIPRNYVDLERSVEVEEVESEDWFFKDTSREKSEGILLSEENATNSFLVRRSEHNPIGYTLSVKYWEEERGYYIKHYEIKPLELGGFYISTDNIFNKVSDLVNNYKASMWDFGPNYRDTWDILKTEIIVTRILYEGLFGPVYYGKWKNNIEVAVKTYKGPKKTGFLEEAAIMKKYRHKNLVTLYGVCSEPEPTYIVHEYMSKGRLLDFLKEDDGEHLKSEDLINIAFQVASGMKYLESEQVIHTDLATRNVVIDEHKTAKICNFELAKVLEGNVYQPDPPLYHGINWSAIETILYNNISIKSNVWSYGILLMELFTFGRVPYPRMTDKEITKLLEEGYRMPKPTAHHVPDKIYEIMLKCWDGNQEKRPTFEFLSYYFEDFKITSESDYVYPSEIIDA